MRFTYYRHYRTLWIVYWQILRREDTGGLSSCGSQVTTALFDHFYSKLKSSTRGLQPDLRTRLEKSNTAGEHIVEIKTLNIDFFPRESHLITFRDPWSFPMLFHPACNPLVRQHLDELAQKVLFPTPRLQFESDLAKG